MTWWMCDECEYVFEGERPPESCPQCHAKCLYNDVTCYVPDCGGPGNLDSRLVAVKAREARNRPA